MCNIVYELLRMDTMYNYASMYRFAFQSLLNCNRSERVSSARIRRQCAEQRWRRRGLRRRNG
jgi:hypothetical protein